jgi:plasmid stability protein
MVPHMSKMIQIRNVPDELHREVKARAARAGMSLSDYLLREVERTVATPPVDVVLARIAARGRPLLEETPAEAVRAERESEREVAVAERAAR